MKKWLLILLLSVCFVTAHASHISGGEMYYTYLGKSPSDPNKLRYAITLLLYKDTTVTGAMVLVIGLRFQIQQQVRQVQTVTSVSLHVVWVPEIVIQLFWNYVKTMLIISVVNLMILRHSTTVVMV